MFCRNAPVQLLCQFVDITLFYTRHFPAGQEAQSVSTFPVLRFRSSSPSEATTWTWRHSLKHLFYGYPQAADTIIAIGHVFVNLTQKYRLNGVPKLVPNMSVVKLNFTFWSFFLEPSKSSFQSASREKHVSWVHTLSTKSEYLPWQTHTHSSFEVPYERKKRFAQVSDPM